MGKKRAKRLEQEEKIISNVTEKLKGAVNNNTSSASGLALARSLEQMSAVFASGLQEWRERQAYANASPSLKRKYDSLILTIRIQQLEQEAAKSASSTRTNQAFLNECIEEAVASAKPNNECIAKRKTHK